MSGANIFIDFFYFSSILALNPTKHEKKESSKN
jgi:hypothetical protein